MISGSSRRRPHPQNLSILASTSLRSPVFMRAFLNISCWLNLAGLLAYWPGLRGDVQTYIKSCTVCIARKSPCPRKIPMGHVEVGHRWDRVAMDLLDMSVTTARGNRYVLVIVDCFTRWTEAFPLPDKTAQSVADAFFNNVVCRFGMPIVIHSDQGREFENKILHELCLIGGSHKTRTSPYHPESDGMVERFNRTLLMMLAMVAGKNRDDWDVLLPAVMMAYRSSVHESTGYSPYRLMFGEECTLPMDIGLPTDPSQPQEELTSPYAIWVRDALEEAYEQVRLHSEFNRALGYGVGSQHNA